MNTEKESFRFADALNELDGGVFEEKLTAAIKEVLLGVAHCDDRRRKGKLTIVLTAENIGDSGTQVMLTHRLTSDRPTRRGKTVVEDETATPMFVCKDGRPSIVPEQQLAFDGMGRNKERV